MKRLFKEAVLFRKKERIMFSCNDNDKCYFANEDLVRKLLFTVGRTTGHERCYFDCDLSKWNIQ